MLDILDEPTPTTRSKGPSFSAQVKALHEGESAAKVKRLALDSTEASNLTEFVRNFRQPIDAFVSKERRASGREYAVEQGTILTGSGFVLVMVAVTRT